MVTVNCRKCSATFTGPGDVVNRMTGRIGFVCDTCFNAGKPAPKTITNIHDLPIFEYAWKGDGADMGI